MSNTQIGAFLQQRIDFNPKSPDGLDAMALYGAYASWCLSAGREPMTNADFCTALRHCGVHHDDQQGLVRFYPGLSIIDPLSPATSAEPTPVLSGPL